MLRALTFLALVAVAAGYMAQGQLPMRAQRSAAPVTMQFGTMNGPNGYDKNGNENGGLSPIVGGSSSYPYGEYEVDTSGALPAQFLALLTLVGLPVTFAYLIFTAKV